MTGNDLNNYHAEVAVSLKDTVNDPQGVTAAKSLQSIGFAGIRSIRIGKMVEVNLVAATEDAAYQMVAEMCEKMFANPVIEQYRIALRTDSSERVS